MNYGITFYLGILSIFGNFWAEFLPLSLQLLVLWPPFCLISWNPRYSFFVKPGFDLTFQKWFVTFPMKITAKLILNLVHHGWRMKNILKGMRLYSTTNNCVKNHLKVNYVIFLIHTEKDHLCFYKNSNQTFAIISKEVVYFKKRLAYHVEHP